MKKAGFVLAAFGLVLGAAEAFLAISGISRSETERFYTDIYDITYELVPHSRMPIGKTPDRASINAHGFHGPPTTREKPPGTRRVICVGDSTTFGFILPYEKSYSALLQKALDKVLSPGQVEVINAGIPGTCITQHNLLIKRKLLFFSPDVIVLYSVPNIAHPNMVALQELRGRLLEKPENWTDHAKKIFRRFHGYRFLRRWIKGGGSPSNRQSDMELALAMTDKELLEKTVVDTYRRDLSHFTRLCKENGILGVLVLTVVEPNVARLAGKNIRPGTRAYEDYFQSERMITLVMDAARENNFPLVNPYDAFVPAAFNGPLFFEDKVHPNEKGHALLAESIAATLLPRL